MAVVPKVLEGRCGGTQNDPEVKSVLKTFTTMYNVQIL